MAKKKKIPKEVLWAWAQYGFISVNRFYKIKEIAKKYPEYFK